jgi:hypothetical protein
MLRTWPIRVSIVFLLACANAGCSARDVSSEPPFANMIGREYRVIADVDAYGIKKNLQDKEASYVELIPRPGISGPEVAFKKQVTRATGWT